MSSDFVESGESSIYLHIFSPEYVVPKTKSAFGAIRTRTMKRIYILEQKVILFWNTAQISV